jgi:hypothetical protein
LPEAPALSPEGFFKKQFQAGVLEKLSVTALANITAVFINNHTSWVHLKPICR